MKKSLFLLAAVLLTAGCGTGTPDPVHEAIKAEISGNMPQKFTDVRIYTVEKIDSSTFRQELDRRKALFVTRRASDEKFILKYNSEGKVKNAARKLESFKKDLQILRDLDSLEVSIADILDDIAYYDYVFSAQASGPDGKMEFRDSYAAITPDMQVIGMTAQKKDLHKGLGKVIPGYLKIVKGEEDETPVEE